MAKLWQDEYPADARNRTTYYKWLNEGVPMTPAGFSLFSFLDIDPTSIIDHKKMRLEQRFNSIRAALLLGEAGMLMGGETVQGLRALLLPILPGAEWPSDTLLRENYGRDWHRRTFTHTAKADKNAMACITLAPTGDDFHPDAPRAWYIAYRPGDGQDPLWRPYGILVRRRSTNYLLSSRGLVVEDDGYKNQSLVRFGTEFGPSPVDFCVASFHPFGLKVEFPTGRECRLRFLP